jgi:predicted Zn finger-like uncharacterized protein
MIVTCPHCSKRYMLDEALLPKEGRQVRCIACDYVWRQVPEASSSLNPLPFMGIEDTIVDSHLSSEKKSWWLAWIIFFAVIFSLVSFFIFGRNVMITYWPQTEKVYDLFGLPLTLSGAGLKIENAASIVHQEGSVAMLQITGDIINTSNRVRSIPSLKLKFLGDSSHPHCLKNHQSKRCILDYWEHRLSESSLLPGERIHFETDPRPQVEGTQHIVVEF